MLVGILKPFRNMYYSALDVYKQILDYNGIEYIELDINSDSFWSEIKNLDLFLARIGQYDNDLALSAQIIPIINLFLNIPCFPNYNTIWHYDDKVKQYYLLKSMGFPVIDSYIFWDKIEALDWAKNTDYPVVFKLKGGAGSANVKLVKSYNRQIPYKKVFWKRHSSLFI
jgi:glutathione synthase/RimK-type ligase-like ATP-grasp enzyme